MDKETSGALEALERATIRMQVATTVRDEIARKYQVGKDINDEILEKVNVFLKEWNEDATKDNEIVQQYLAKLFSKFEKQEK